MITMKIMQVYFLHFFTVVSNANKFSPRIWKLSSKNLFDLTVRYLGRNTTTLQKNPKHIVMQNHDSFR